MRARNPEVVSSTLVPDARRTTQLPSRCRSLLLGLKCSTVRTCRSPTTMSARPARTGSTSRGMSEAGYWLSASVLTIASAPSLSAASSPAWKAVASPRCPVRRTIDAVPARDLDRAVGGAVVDHQPLDPVEAGELPGSSASTWGSVSSSFRQGIWMISFIGRIGLSVVSAADLEVLRLGDGPPVLFVHGSVVAADLTWRRQLELSERWRLIVPNRPGFAGSPRSSVATSRWRHRSSPSCSAAEHISSGTPTEA